MIQGTGGTGLGASRHVLLRSLGSVGSLECTGVQVKDADVVIICASE